jgi:hypothetical protein
MGLTYLYLDLARLADWLWETFGRALPTVSALIKLAGKGLRVIARDSYCQSVANFLVAAFFFGENSS